MHNLAAWRDTYQPFVMQNAFNVYVYYASIKTTCEVTLKAFEPKIFGLRAQRLTTWPPHLWNQPQTPSRVTTPMEAPDQAFRGSWNHSCPSQLPL